MLVKTAGIVVRQVKYSENTVIVHLYTRQLGMKSYIVNGVNSSRAVVKPGLLQPLMLLDLVVYNNPTKEIQRIKEAKASPSLLRVHFEVLRSSIALFIAEIIDKTIKEEESNTALYDFLQKFILLLDQSENLGILPAYFSLHLSRFLGFFPQADYSHEKVYFNLSEGRFMTLPDRPENTVEPIHSQYLSKMLDHGLEDLDNLHIPRESRTVIFSKLMDYYLLHIPGFRPLKSPDVLSNLMKA